MNTLTIDHLNGAITKCSPFHQLEVHVSPLLPAGEMRQVRFPRSKKRRIHKKWRRDRRNHGLVHLPIMYQTPMGLIVNTTAWEQMKAQAQGGRGA